MKHQHLLWLLLTLFCSSVVEGAAKAESDNLPLRQQEIIVSAAQLEAKESKAPTSHSEEPFALLPQGVDGMIAPEIAAFYPNGMSDTNAPTSLALVKRPRLSSSLPSSWSLHPVFSSNGRFNRATLGIPPEVDLYGGGEVTGPLRRNGTTIKLWNTDNYAYGKDGGRRLYQSQPWIIGVRPDGSAFGVLFDSSWKGELSCKNGITFTVEGPGFPVLVIQRASPEGVLQALGELTGKMELPPLWALGYQQCRYSYYPESQVREIAAGFRTRKIPCDVIWMDIDYMDGFRVFSFSKEYFPDPKGINDDLHRRGFKSVWMIDPGIKVDPEYKVYVSGQAQDVYVKSHDGSEYQGSVWPGPCAFPDFTRPETRHWWSSLYAPYMANGIDGVWNDMNEPAVFKGPDGTMPEDNLHRGGGELPPDIHRKYHNAYGMLMAQATRNGILAANPDKRPFVLTRSNFLGGQRYAATWTGDNRSSDKFMKLSVPMTLTLGLSGQPFNGPDLGGFDGMATPELWGQWIGFGSLFPFARGHASKGANSKEPWSFGKEVEQTARLALERRYRLMPYLYTLFRESSLTGLPVMRPTFMADVTDKTLRREQEAFLLGRDLLVIPSWAKSPALPHVFYPVISIVHGDLEDPDQATLRMRPGAIIPLGKVIQNTTENSLDPLTLLVCLDTKGEASGRLYEDAGDGFGYRSGDYLLTTFEARRDGEKTIVSISGKEGNRPWKKRVVRIQAVDSTGMHPSFEQEL